MNMRIHISGNFITLYEVVQLCPTLCNTMDCSLLGSSIHGILQARILELVAKNKKLKKIIGGSRTV